MDFHFECIHSMIGKCLSGGKAKSFYEYTPFVLTQYK